MIPFAGKYRQDAPPQHENAIVVELGRNPRELVKEIKKQLKLRST
jgi:hypothetical protein